MLNKRGLSAGRTGRQGFTLIELMVAISIVAILSTVGMTFYGSAQKAARDAKRKQDLRSVSTALEIYRQVNKVYPASGGAWAGGRISSELITNPWIPGLDTKYISNVPRDPKKTNADPLSADTNFGYVYWSGPNSGGNCPGDTLYYILMAKMENPDPERWELKQTTFCNGSSLFPGIAPTTTRYKDLFIITSE